MNYFRTTGLYTQTLAKIILHDVTRSMAVFIVIFLSFCGALSLSFCYSDQDQQSRCVFFFSLFDTATCIRLCLQQARTGNVEENTYKTKMSDQQDIFNIRRQMSSADHEVVTVSRNIVTMLPSCNPNNWELKNKFWMIII